jgi:hypothetical protein
MFLGQSYDCEDSLQQNNDVPLQLPATKQKRNQKILEEDREGRSQEVFSKSLWGLSPFKHPTNSTILEQGIKLLNDFVLSCNDFFSTLIWNSKIDDSLTELLHSTTLKTWWKAVCSNTFTELSLDIEYFCRDVVFFVPETCFSKVHVLQYC